MKTIDIVMYAALIGFTLYMTRIEKKDWECPSPHSPDKDCNGNGMPHRNSKSQPDDTCQELTERINRAAGAERKSIKWRRSLAISVGIMLALYILVAGGLPDWIQFYLSVMVGFVIIRFQFAWYSYHKFKLAEENIYESIDRLQKCI